MLKKLSFALSAFALLLGVAACSRNNEDEIEENTTVAYEPEDRAPTVEELRDKFESFFEENKDSIIASIATDGEDVRLELADGHEFIMTIVLDDIELNDENRAIYLLSFELTFADMSDLFGGLAREIKEAAEINYFRLTVIFVDVNEEIIARSSFDVGDRRFFLDENDVEVEEETD